MVTTVMEAHDKKSSVPIHFANIWNMNAVPAGSASSGKLVILSVKKKAMADHMDFALTPNFHIESDLSNIDFHKVKKQMMLVAKCVTIQFVQRQMMWPKNVCPLIPLVPKVQAQLFVFSRGKKTHHNAPHPG